MDGLLPLSTGWYGKLPSRGDFVGRGLPRPWLRTWDAWLQRALAAGAQQPGAATLRERLQAMPPWQCLVLPQRSGDAAWCGIVVSSSDRVGRVFPLLLAEAYELQALGAVDVNVLRARGISMLQWLSGSRQMHSPKDLEAATAAWASTALECPAADDTRPGTDIDHLRSDWPAAGSFWWRVGPATEPWKPHAETWPPAEDLLLHLLDGPPAQAPVLTTDDTAS